MSRNSTSLPSSLSNPFCPVASTNERSSIIRILFMVPIYSVVSVLSYLYYWHAIYFEVIRDCYEAFAIASFFFLLCNYIAPNLHAQKDYFRQLQPKGWPWPARYYKYCWGPRKGEKMFRKPRSGLTWFNVRVIPEPSTLSGACVAYSWNRLSGLASSSTVASVSS